MRNLTVIHASAGSGKTFNLARFFLALLLSSGFGSIHQKLRSIMALTFTRKATQEMKDRILYFLEVIDEEENSALKSVLLSLLEDEIQVNQNELIQRSRKARKIILENYQDFSVGTLDSFSHSLVRSYSHELQIDQAFEVSLETDKWLELSIDRLLDRYDSVNCKDPLSITLLRFCRSQLEGDTQSWNLKQITKEFARGVLTDQFDVLLMEHPSFYQIDFQSVKKYIEQQIDRYVAALKQTSCRALELIQSDGISPVAMYRGKSGIYSFFEKAAQSKAIFDKIPSVVEEVQTKNIWYSAKASPETREKLSKLNPTLNKLLQDLLNLKEKNRYLYDYKLIGKNLDLLALISYLQSELNEVKKENRVLTIDDFNRIIFEIVNQDPVPFIYERLGTRYRYFLIDEFQDTSLRQFHNLVPLLDNALATGHQSLLVGDGKQAIYRFRDGDVELFNRLPHIHGRKPVHYEDFERQFQRNFNAQTLPANFRSGFEIVNFNNRFYHQLAQALGPLSSVYENQDQIPQKKESGYVTLSLFPNEITPNDCYPEKTLELIQERLDDGYTHGEIAVIARYSKDLKYLADFLSSKKIPIETSETLLLEHHPEIQILMVAMAYLSDPKNELFRYRLHAILSQLFPLEEISFFASLAEKNDGLKKYPKLYELESLSDLTLGEMAIQINDCLQLNLAESAYFFSLLDHLKAFVQKQGNHLGAWVAHFQKEALKVATPSDSDAVKLLTIHKAKGLEFPVVILPYLDWMIMNTKNYAWVSPSDELKKQVPFSVVKLTNELKGSSFEQDLIEEKLKSKLDEFNALYVATTRASENMHLLIRKTSEDNRLSTYLLSALKNLKEEDADFISFGKRTQKRTKTASNIDGSEHHAPFLTSRTHGFKTLKQSQPTSEKQSRLIEYGKNVHRVLSNVIHSRDLNRALRQAKESFELDEKQCQEIKTGLEQLWQNPEVLSWYEEGVEVFNERELLSPSGEIFRPDRVVIKEDETIVIDYKTGMVEDASLKKYTLQLAAYKSALETMGLPCLRSYIIVLPEGILLPM